MRRRHFAITAGAGAATGLVGLSGCGAAPVSRFATLRQAREAVLELLFKTPVHDGAWTLSQLLQHLAQSVEYSMQGYPQMKSAAFRALIGGSAFALFNAAGSMRHDLGEPIPGAPALQADLRLKVAAQRLIDALAAFEAWGGPLQPHFAYGELDKAQYGRAHLMHIANHWSRLQGPRSA